MSVIRYRSLVLMGLIAACSPNAEEVGIDDGRPMVAPSDGPVLCGDECDNPNTGDVTNIQTEGAGTVIFGGEDVSAGGGGIRLSDKIDLVFVVDNSVSMGDKQQIFSQAIPDLIERLVNPPCLNTELTESVQPATPEDVCPVGFGRQFAPLKDIHVGIITSSLGAHGADTPADNCAQVDSDRAYMIGALPRGAANPSYRDLGFLRWDPEQRTDPPGETNLTALTDGFLNMLGAVGEEGCGFEAPLEAMYRFLMDPAPDATLERVSCGDTDPGQNCVRGSGIDEQLLAQRNAFLRPDSVVAIIMLADEDDCSVRDTDIGWWNVDVQRGITRASSACEADPNSACCYSCSFATPAGCPAKEEDAACSLGELIAPQEEAETVGQNLRCFDQKRKYGYDYLYPVQRYVLGLTSPWLPEGFDYQGRPLRGDDGEIKFLRNPLFSEPVDSDGNVRSKEQVFFVGIVGVPWQDVATDESRDVTGQLDLVPARQFDTTGLWERILGTDTVPPLDPFARESKLPRTGTHPITNDAIMPPDSAELNGINGKERLASDDLQYSCIFPLPEARDCSAGNVGAGAACDCRADTFDGNPLCWDAELGAYATEQHFAKAYPAPRILKVLQGIGNQAVVASICPKNVTDTSLRDFGYRPVIGTFIREAAVVLIK